MFSIEEKSAIQYLECPASGLNFTLHAFCTRRGGVSVGSFSSLNVSVREGDGPENVRLNIERIASSFGISETQLLMLRQVHQDDVWVIDENTPIAPHDYPRECDAVITDREGLALCIKTADCAPVFLADPVRRIIGAVHAGWKGTALRITQKTVGEMQKRFGARPSDLTAAVGPAIGPCCYEVDAVVHRAMSHHASRDSCFLNGRQPGRWMLDLSLANRNQLLECGLQPERIFATPCCTACHPDLFFSHRACKGDTGRQLNFIMIRSRLQKSA
jgi:hypothetical protein